MKNLLEDSYEHYSYFLKKGSVITKANPHHDESGRFTSAEEYAEEFGLDTAEKIIAHINAKVGTPYWSGVPLEIKAGLVRIAGNMNQ